jgi:hypothetical protein
MGVQQNGAIVLVESCELDKWPSNEGLRPNRGKVGCLLHATILGGNTSDPNQEMKLKEELKFWSIVLEGRAAHGRAKSIIRYLPFPPLSCIGK